MLIYDIEVGSTKKKNNPANVYKFVDKTIFIENPRQKLK